MSQTLSAQVVLQGLRFYGRSISVPGQMAGEVVIISESADYQGALCDPAIAGKIAVMTYPHIGNTGWRKLDGKIQAAAVLMAFYEDFKSPDGLTLAEALIQAGVPAIAGLDTRAVAKAVMEKKFSPIAAFSTSGDDPSELLTTVRTAGENPWYKAAAEPPALKPATGKRTDLKKILIVGSGPIVIGQACEFDYSGVQATKTLRAEGYEVILINSNPATIMTDPGLADQTYIEPLKPEYVEAVIAKERPQAILATMGGQTALNMAMTLAESGVLDKYGVEIIGADYETIKRAENRESFRDTVVKAGLKIPQSGVINSLEAAKSLAAEIGFPVIIRPSFTLGGAGGGVAWNQEDLAVIVEQGLGLSLNHEVLLEKSVIGWKELEVEILCDQKGRMVTVCTIENIDPMGVHTGDSITVAPAQTLTGAETDLLIEQSRAAAQALGIRNSGCNLQFAMHPDTGELLIIEVNPRVSRSSALASKATGVPIAKISSLLAVGYNLDEILLEMTGEPVTAVPIVIDYVAAKIPRWNFEKFPGATDELTTSMRSVGEVMSLGRSFLEALQKGFRSLETPVRALLADPRNPALAGAPLDREALERKLRVPNSERLYYLTQAMRQGWSVDEIYEITSITPWFLKKIEMLVKTEEELKKFDFSPLASAEALDRLDAHDLEKLADDLRRFKNFGFSDAQLAFYAGLSEDQVRAARLALDVRPAYKAVDACAGRLPAQSPYYYSTYQSQVEEARPGQRDRVVIIGNGPNRIGQGLEFDYCCVHAAYALRDMGIDAVMINSNPETVSTDYDTSSRLYFEPLTFEDVMNVIEVEKPLGVIIQFGGQTPLNLAQRLAEAGVKILGTSPESIDQAEDRERFTALIRELGLSQPEHGNAHTLEEARAIAARLGYPVLVRPSYVLGGRNMRIIHSDEDLAEYVHTTESFSEKHPLLIDKFLSEALELDVDALSDGWETVIGGIIEQIEEGGIHSGDSSGLMPPNSLGSHQLEEIRRATRALARSLKVVGLMNIQFAVKGRTVYVLEVNPRASRTAPFVSKATGLPLPALATKVVMGSRLADLGIKEVELSYVAVKESVFSFDRFPGVDPILGPEMRSTGEVMGIDPSYGLAIGKAFMAAGTALPTSGRVFLSVRDDDKPLAARVARQLADLDFTLMATPGTASFLRANGLTVENVNKVSAGRPNALDHLKNSHLHLVINTTMGRQTVLDSESIRRTAILCKVPIITTMAGAAAAAEAIAGMKHGGITVQSIQDYYKGRETPRSK